MRNLLEMTRAFQSAIFGPSLIHAPPIKTQNFEKFSSFFQHFHQNIVGGEEKKSLGAPNTNIDSRPEASFVKILIQLWLHKMFKPL